MGSFVCTNTSEETYFQQRVLEEVQHVSNKTVLQASELLVR
jgi:hypothetical protein